MGVRNLRWCYQLYQLPLLSVLFIFDVGIRWCTLLHRHRYVPSTDRLVPLCLPLPFRPSFPSMRLFCSSECKYMNYRYSTPPIWTHPLLWDFQCDNMLVDKSNFNQKLNNFPNISPHGIISACGTFYAATLLQGLVLGLRLNLTSSGGLDPHCHRHFPTFPDHYDTAPASLY